MERQRRKTVARPRRDELRGQLREAFTHAVDGEMRWGRTVDVRPELTQRWDRVIRLIEELIGG